MTKYTSDVKKKKTVWRSSFLLLLWKQATSLTTVNGCAGMSSSVSNCSLQWEISNFSKNLYSMSVFLLSGPLAKWTSIAIIFAPPSLSFFMDLCVCVRSIAYFMDY